VNEEKFLNKNKRSKALDRADYVDESLIERDFCNYAKQMGCAPLKLYTQAIRGFPDRTVLCPGGKVLFIEFKSNRGQLSAPQVLMKGRIETLGFKYHVCDKVGEAEAILRKFLHG